MLKKHLLLILRNKDALIYGLAFPLCYVLIYSFALSKLFLGSAEFSPAKVILHVQAEPDVQASVINMFSKVAEIKSDLASLDKTITQAETDNINDASDSHKIMQIVVAKSETEKIALSKEGKTVGNIVVKASDNAAPKFNFEVDPSKSESFHASLVYEVLNRLAQVNKAIYFSSAKLEQNYADSKMWADYGKNLKQAFSSKLTQEFKPGSAVSSQMACLYSLLAYLCMYFMSFGSNLHASTDAAVNPVALRTLASPYPKHKIIFYYSLVTYMLSLLAVYASAAFLVLRFNSLQKNISLMFIILTLGTLLANNLGLFISRILMLNKDVLMAINVALPLFMAACAGMMSENLRTLIIEKLPWLNTCNPLAVISDAIYALQVSDIALFKHKLLVICLEIVIFMSLNYCLGRRKLYAKL